MSSSWIWDNQERNHYYLLPNGSRVWAQANQYAPSKEVSSSVAGKYRSVNSQYEGMGYPSSQSNSYPPSTAPRDLAKRMAAGYDPRMDYGGRYGSPQADYHAGSAPAASRDDLFRDLMDPKKSKHGPPQDSNFTQKSTEYHDEDTAGGAIQLAYKSAIKDAEDGGPSHVTRREAAKAPNGAYVGVPLQTREWHRMVAELALKANTNCEK